MLREPLLGLPSQPAWMAQLLQGVEFNPESGEEFRRFFLLDTERLHEPSCKDGNPAVSWVGVTGATAWGEQAPGLLGCLGKSEAQDVRSRTRVLGEETRRRRTRPAGTQREDGGAGGQTNCHLGSEDRLPSKKHQQPLSRRSALSTA